MINLKPGRIISSHGAVTKMGCLISKLILTLQNIPSSAHHVYVRPAVRRCRDDISWIKLEGDYLNETCCAVSWRRSRQMLSADSIYRAARSTGKRQKRLITLKPATSDVPPQREKDQLWSDWRHEVWSGAAILKILFVQSSKATWTFTERQNSRRALREKNGTQKPREAVICEKY